MSGGTVMVNGPTNDGNGAIDADGTPSVTGGTLVAAGSSGMAMAPGTDGQGWVSATFDTAQPAGTTLAVVAADGTVVATFTPAKDITSLVLSAAGITSGETYTVVSGATAAGDAFAGYTTGGDASGGTEVATVTAGEHTGGMGGGMGGGPGGGQAPGGGQPGTRPGADA